MNKKETVLIISPHSDVKLKEEPRFGFERRISYLSRIIDEKYDISILEANDFKRKEEKNNLKKSYFSSFPLFKIKNMRFGSFFLDLNPLFMLKLLKVCKEKSPRVVIVSFPWGILITSFLIKKILRFNTKIIYNAHNVESEYSKIILNDREIPRILKIFYKIYTYKIEKMSCLKSDYIFSVSDENKDIFIDKYGCGGEKIICIPVGSELPLDKQNIEKNNNFGKNNNEIFAFFHGTYKSTHNREAFDLIYNFISKKLKHLMNLKFVTSGKGVPEFNKDNILSLGFVKNLSELLAQCDIAIVPLEHGEGTKLKIYDYLSAGLPIVTTKKGAEGIKFVNKKNAIITDHVDEQFLDAIENLVKNPDLRFEIGKNGRELLIEKYHPDSIKENLYRLLDKIMFEKKIKYGDK